jgi:uncharacterized membrane protein
MQKLYLSNAFLSLGVLTLLGFGLIEMNGIQSDPLLPAFAALFIGCTAVLDRVSFLNQK